ncbi:MAG: glycosyltransferase family 2 protein [Gammaproteobacteria bacterium]|nr:glycosyltransferase family 2 protein [Gammaproteobacteria bacterium]
MSRLDVVIVNWNTRQHLESCLRTLRAARRDGFTLGDIWIVDNASADGSREFIAAQQDCRPIFNDSNRGFAAACNQGAGQVAGDFILFLNPDVHVGGDSLVETVQYLLSPGSKDVGIVGVRLLDETGRVQRSCARFPTACGLLGLTLHLDRVIPALVKPHFLLEWDHGSTREVDQVMGAFFMVRRAVFEQLLGFDERFFVYYEDLDFAFRARGCGWKTVFLAAAGAVHAGGAASRQALSRRMHYGLCSRTAYARKHFGIAVAALVTVAALTIELALRLGHELVRNNGRGLGDIAGAYADFALVCGTYVRTGRPA